MNMAAVGVGGQQLNQSLQVNLVGRNAQARLGQSYNHHPGKVGGINSILGNKNALFFGRNPDPPADGLISSSNKSVKAKG